MIRYNVIESKGKVTAELFNCENDAYNVIRKHLPYYVKVDKSAVKMRSHFKAVAKCHPEDTFNAEEGKAIAKERLIAKYNKSMRSVLVDVLSDFVITTDGLELKLPTFEEY